jgi:hypothetical protein
MVGMSHSNSAKPRRRWFQFSLRSLLILITVLAVWLGLQVNRVNRQRRAVEAITELGGQFSYDYQRKPGLSGGVFIRGTMGPVPHSYSDRVEPPGPAWLRRLMGEHYFVTPVRLSIGDQRVIDEGRLRYLRDLPRIEELSLANVVVRPDDLPQTPDEAQKSAIARYGAERCGAMGL